MQGEGKELNICLLQYNIKWEDPDANFDIVRQLVQGTSADIYFLPEMFSTGFTMHPEKHAEPFCGRSFNFLQTLAIENNAVYTASIPTKFGGNYYNRLYWVEPNETFITYDKRHLFTLVGEEKHYTAGNERKVIDYKGWKIMPQVCYDLRFPVFSRNNLKYDIVFYVANWPTVRRYAWNQLLKARAIENMSYCIGVNRIGQDANGMEYSGDSCTYDSLGQPLVNQNLKGNVLQFTLRKEDLEATRNKFKFLNDQDDFSIEL